LGEVYVGLDVVYEPVASIWFEIWGVVNPGKEISDYSEEISENFLIFQANYPEDLF